MIYSEIKQEAKQALYGNRFMYLLAIIVTGAISGALAFIGIGFLMVPVFMGGLYLLSKSLLKKQAFDFGIVFSTLKDLNHALKLIGVMFLTVLIVFAGFILFIIPGIIFAYQFSQAMYLMTDNPNMGVWEAMKESRKLMVGHKFEFFVFQLSFILHILLAIITFGIYYLYFIPYYQVSLHNYYCHLTGQNLGFKDQKKSDDILVEFA